MIHGDYVRFVEQTGLHSVTQYELYKAIWSSLNDANFFELAWALRRHETFARAFAPFTFVGNHDVTRLMTRLRNPSRLGHALAVLFTTPGSPCVYYGDEFAFRGVKGRGVRGDDAIRPRLPDSPFAQNAEQAAAFELHRQLIAMRAERPWLTTGHIQVVELAMEQMRYTVAGAEASCSSCSTSPPRAPSQSISRAGGGLPGRISRMTGRFQQVPGASGHDDDPN